MPVSRDQVDLVGSCWECGYSLRGLESARCPECGRGFDPNNPATINMGENVSAFARRMMKPPGWPMYSLVAVASLLSVWAAASPMPSGDIGSVIMTFWYEWKSPTTGGTQLLWHVEALEVRFCYAFIAWGVVGIFWFARRIIRGATVRRVARQRPATFAYWRRWLIPHFVLAAVVLFCMTPAPVYVGFWLSKSGIEQARSDQLAHGTGWGRSAWTPPKWRGIYPIGGRRQWVWTTTSPGDVFISRWGDFVYSPGGPPKGPQSYLHARYLGGDWYSIERPWVGR